MKALVFCPFDITAVWLTRPLWFAAKLDESADNRSESDVVAYVLHKDFNINKHILGM